MPKDTFGGAFGHIYSAYMARPWLAEAIARAVWGGSLRPFYRSMEAIAAAPQGATVVDAPCGAGPAFRAVDPAQDIRYLALDLSAAMVERARREARRLGLRQVEVMQGDACALPLEDDVADLFCSYWGLHCFADPARGLREAARVLKPGGELVGAMIVQGESLWQRLLVVPRRGAFGPIGHRADLERWLADAGFADVSLEGDGSMLYFRARAG